MASVSTKERILESALTLFAEKGYDGVGVDLIAENAGLKGPSIYKHFKGKEAILDALLETVESYYSSNFGSAANPGAVPPSFDALIEVSHRKIEFTLHDPMIRKSRRLLMMEQFRNARIAEIATMHSVTGLQSMYSRIFSAMMEAGTMKPGNPDLLAMEFIAPVTLMIQICDRQPELEKKCLENVEIHFRHFAETYGISDNR